MNTLKRLDQKLAAIHADPHTCKEFIIADAKDADMAFGITAPGPDRNTCRHGFNESEGCFKTLADYRDQIRDVIRQDLVDIVLLSASNLEQLGMKEKLFENSPITPAARANDTSDIWVVRGGKYPTDYPSRTFRTATLDHIKYGRITGDHSQPFIGADLGLYSITFTNNLDYDHQALMAFQDFRIEAEKKKFRYFLELFNPNVDPGLSDKQVASFLNDHIVRTLAGVTEAGRPVFLKIPYNGPGPLEELVSYDPQLIVGILGGSSGTTMDAFQLIYDAQKYGARVALFGRKINLSEHPLAFIELLRRIVEGEVGPREAVKAYHGVLQKLGIKPIRTLQQDLLLSKTSTSYKS
ncbi:MAG: hypothetical protein JJU05_11650 [Verrucomicrobia bacterium]|nr:hypothetical protein [Verrucomicrobiota bacterium]MCH8528587.1 hypothetical protein [Kiritimatiellia bacterium]